MAKVRARRVATGSPGFSGADRPARQCLPLFADGECFISIRGVQDGVLSNKMYGLKSALTTGPKSPVTLSPLRLNASSSSDILAQTRPVEVHYARCACKKLVGTGSAGGRSRAVWTSDVLPSRYHACNACAFVRSLRFG